MLNRADEDVEQEIYIRLWQKFPTYREQEKLGAWIRVVAENFAKIILRAKAESFWLLRSGRKKAGWPIWQRQTIPNGRGCANAGSG